MHWGKTRESPSLLLGQSVEKLISSKHMEMSGALTSYHSPGTISSGNLQNRKSSFKAIQGIYGRVPRCEVFLSDMCQDPKKILAPGSPGSGILQDLVSYIFIFSWNHRDLGFRHHNIAVGSQGSWISDRKDFAGSWGSRSKLSSCRGILQILDLATTIRSLYFEHSLQAMTFCFQFPIYLCAA